MKVATPIAVTSRSFSHHPMLRAELLAQYSRVTFNDAGMSLAGEALVTFLRGHEMVISALERLDSDVFAAVPELKVVSKYGVGLDMLDLPAMERRGVKLGWTPGVNRRSVAELVVGFAISLLHRTPAAGIDVRDGAWHQIVGRELTGKTVGVIGCGHVGKDVAILMRAFDCRVLAHDIRDYAEFYARHDIRPADLQTLLRDSDIVTLHVPLDASTRNILGEGRLAQMKNGAILINAARGQLVDESSVKRMLMGGHLAGAAFDVFSSEPPDDLELVRLPNFIGTPHIGGSTEEAILAMGRAAIRGLDEASPVVWSDLARLIAPGVRPTS